MFGLFEPLASTSTASVRIVVRSLIKPKKNKNIVVESIAKLCVVVVVVLVASLYATHKVADELALIDAKFSTESPRLTVPLFVSTEPVSHRYLL